LLRRLLNIVYWLSFIYFYVSFSFQSKILKFGLLILLMYNFFFVFVDDSVLQNWILNTCVHSNPISLFHAISFWFYWFNRLNIRLCNTLSIISFTGVIKMGKICIHSCQLWISFLGIVHVRAAWIALRSYFNFILWREIHLLWVNKLTVNSWILWCEFRFMNAVRRIVFNTRAWRCLNISQRCFLIWNLILLLVIHRRLLNILVKHYIFELYNFYYFI
jgi:hypothetical protein